MKTHKENKYHKGLHNRTYCGRLISENDPDDRSRFFFVPKARVVDDEENVTCKVCNKAIKA